MKKKINVLDWLNEHVKPNITFDNLFENFTINNNDGDCNNDIKNINLKNKKQGKHLPNFILHAMGLNKVN